MAYRFYMAGVLLPVTPGAVTLKVKSNNKVVSLIDEGDINILKAPGLKEIKFDAILPNQDYPFNNSGSARAGYYANLLETLKTGRIPFQFVITRSFPDGRGLDGTSIRMTLEDYSIKEDADTEGFDKKATIQLKEYREYGTKTVQISGNKGYTQGTRETDNAPSDSSYTVKSGDSLWAIAKKYYNNGAEWTKIYESNKSVVGNNPNLIYPGQVLAIP